MKKILVIAIVLLLIVPFQQSEVVERLLPVVKRPLPQFDNGTLLLVGGGRIPPIAAERFLMLAGGDKAHIVVIPSASNTCDPKEVFERWSKKKIASVNVIHCSRQDADNIIFYNKINEATGVWIGGGDQSLLTA